MSIQNGIEEKTIEVQGIKLHVILAGEGKPLILLHGFPDFWYGWKNIIAGLKNDFRLIVPDMRGYNLSEKPEGLENYKIETLVDDIKNLSEKFNVEKFSLTGHDWGGTVSWVFAETYPELLNHLIIINSPHPKLFQDKIKGNKKQKQASGYMSQIIKPDGAHMLKRNDYQMLKFSVFGTARKKDAFSEKDKEKYVSAWNQPGAINAGINYYRANRNFKNLSGKFDVPTLVFHGMKDNFIKPVVLKGLKELLDDVSIVKIKNASH